MTARDGAIQVACVAASAAGAASVVWRASRAASLGREEAAVWFLIAYAVFSVVGLGLSGAFTVTRKAVLIASCVVIAALLPLALTGRLGAPSLPLIVFGPSLPFVAASRLARPPDFGPEADPSPTLSRLLRGKRFRAATAVGARKPTIARDEILF